MSWIDRLFILVGVAIGLLIMAQIAHEAAHPKHTAPRPAVMMYRIRADALNFGHPAPQCPVEGHKGPVCQMRACAKYDESGKVTGKRCSMFCAKSCCGCGEACTMDEGSSPDEEWFGAMFSLPVGG